MRLRFPVELRRQIEEAASANRRSLNAEITARLEASFGGKRPSPFLSKAAAKAAGEREDAEELEEWKASIEKRLIELERRN